jgi:hypothetical protein
VIALLTAIVTKIQTTPALLAIVGTSPAPASAKGPFLGGAPEGMDPAAGYVSYHVIPDRKNQYAMGTTSYMEAVTVQFSVWNAAANTALTNAETISAAFHRQALTLGAGTVIGAVAPRPPTLIKQRSRGLAGEEIYLCAVDITFTVDKTP